MFCPNCGGKIEGKFCGQCGAQIPDDVLQELKKQEAEDAAKKVAESEVQTFDPNKNKTVKIDERKERRSDVKGTIAVAGLVVLLIAAGAFIIAFGVKNSNELKTQAKEITTQIFNENEVEVAEAAAEAEVVENKAVAEAEEVTEEDIEDTIKSGDLLYKNSEETKAETKVETKAETKAATKAETKAETKAATKAETKAETKAAKKSAAKAEAETEAEIEYEAEAEVETKATKKTTDTAEIGAEVDADYAESLRAAAKIKTQELIAAAGKSGAANPNDAMGGVETSGEPFTAVEIFNY